MILADSLGATFDKPEFTAGVRYGLIALAVALVAGLAWRFALRRRHAVPIAGVLAVGAFVAGVADAVDLPARLWQGLVLLAAAGAVAALAGRIHPALRWTGAVLALPGAWLLATRTGLVDVTWVRVLVVVTAAAGGALVDDFDRRHRDEGLGPVLLAVAVVGLLTTVPDTERALVLVGATVFLALAAWPWALASVGAAGAYAFCGALAWTAAFDGRGRLTSVIGGVACLGLLVAEPLARLVAGRRTTALDRIPRRWWAPVAVGALQLVVVFVAARVAGLRHDLRPAAVIAAVDLVLAAAVLAAARPSVEPA